MPDEPEAAQTCDRGDKARTRDALAKLPPDARVYEGPVAVLTSECDPRDMGEPREFWQDGVTYLVVPAASCWRHAPLAGPFDWNDVEPDLLKTLAEAIDDERPSSTVEPWPMVTHEFAMEVLANLWRRGYRVVERS